MKYFKSSPREVDRCYHGMAHPQVVGLRDVFQLWRVVASNLLCLGNICFKTRGNTADLKWTNC
jgi:hypothetical protein